MCRARIDVVRGAAGESRTGKFADDDDEIGCEEWNSLPVAARRCSFAELGMNENGIRKGGEEQKKR